jgi:hypothetical protein
MSDEDFQLATARQLLVRLERLSADSYWSHRASGLRGSLMKCVEQIETTREMGQTVYRETWHQLKKLNSRGFWFLESATREIRVKNKPLS